jgi:hypothetical protein
MEIVTCSSFSGTACSKRYLLIGDLVAKYAELTRDGVLTQREILHRLVGLEGDVTELQPEQRSVGFLDLIHADPYLADRLPGFVLKWNNVEDGSESDSIIPVVAGTELNDVSEPLHL